MIEEHDRIILLKDLPEDGLQADNIGTVVYIHSQGEVFEVEFMTLDGGTVAVVTLLSSQIRESLLNNFLLALTIYSFKLIKTY